MMKLIVFFFLCFSPLLAVTEKEACGKELQQIDKEIGKLNAEKQKHLDLSIQYQKQGDNWQYNTGRIQDAYSAWGKASEERQKAIELQIQIDELIEKKQRIIQFYPELWSP